MATYPSGSTHVSGFAFNVPANGAGAAADLTTTITITNTTSAQQVMAGYVLLDGVQIDALPMVVQPGTLRYDFTTVLTGLAAGAHNLDHYLYANVNGLYCTWLRVTGPMFFA